MQRLFFDHLGHQETEQGGLLPSEAFSSFKELASLLKLQGVAGPNKLPMDSSWVVFVHAGDESGCSRSNWKSKVDLSKNRWVVLVSQRGWQALKNNEPGVLSIPRPLESVVQRLNSIPELKEEFEKNCEMETKPDISRWLDVWPERVLAWYLLNKAGMDLDSKILSNADISDAAVLQEFVNHTLVRFWKESQEDISDSLDVALVRRLLNNVSDSGA